LVSIVAIPGSVGKTQIGPLSDKKRHCDGEAPKRVWQPESAIRATEVSLPEILNSFRRIISWTQLRQHLSFFVLYASIACLFRARDGWHNRQNEVRSESVCFL